MIKTITAMYFSPTGTTEKTVLRIAENLSEKINIKLKKINFTLPENRERMYCFEEQDLVVFGVPVIAGRVPNVLLKFLDTIEGGGAFVVPVVLFGNRNYDDALIELKTILEDKNFTPIAAAAFIGEHSFSKILAADRPDDNDLKIADDFSEKILEKIKNNKNLHSLLKVNGEVPIRPYYQPRDRAGNFIDIRKVKPKTLDICDNCKICANVCPMGSIDFDNVKELTGICIKCGACIKKCHLNAKYYDDQGYLYHKEELEIQYQRRAEPEIFI